MSKSNWIRAFAPISSYELLKAAKETEKWISGFGREVDGGMCWEIIPGEETPETILLGDRSLYSGAAGIVIFYLRLYLATGEQEYLDKAGKGIDFIIANYKGNEDFKSDSPLSGCDIGHLGGPTGGAFASELLYEITNENKYREFAIKVTDDLIAAANVEEDNLTWTGQYGIIGEGGLVLYLVYAYETLGDERYLEAAVKAGNFIADKAEAAPGGGYRWYAMPTDTFPTLGAKPGGYFPGFFYGTAGSSYILATIAAHTGDERFLDIAKGGAEYILNIADYSEDGEAALVRYNDPLANDLYYLGMCQGPVGVSRLFFRLFEITGEDKYKDFVIKLTNGILAAGAPKVHSPGYWRTYSYCCGAAGMLEHFISVYRITDDHLYLNAAYDAAETLIGESYEDETGRRWYTAWNRHEPHTAQAFAGLYVGSTGVASSFVLLYELLQNNINYPGYIEDPFFESKVQK